MIPIKQHNLFISNQWIETKNKLKVINPYSHELLAEVSLAGEQELNAAIDAAEIAFEKTKQLTSHERAEACKSIAQQLQIRREEFAKTIAMESGKPLIYSRIEVDRAISTFTIAAEEATRIYGEVMPLDITSFSGNRIGITKRFPIGVISCISPFNFPLNLVAHKLAPAIASGNTVVLKPASGTPLTALLLAEVISNTHLPKGTVNVVPCDRHSAELLTTDGRIKMVSFTGSPVVGWDIKAKAGKKKVVLELGGNAAVIIDKDANITKAAQKCCTGAFAYSGQICVSTQRIYCHENVYDAFLEELKKCTEKLLAGNPLDEKTTFGPMIDEKNALRIEQWVNEAVGKGAKIIQEGKRDKAFYPATILSNVSKETAICTEEAFGPIVIVEKVDSFNAALLQVNDSLFGLQAGIFSNDINNLMKAFNTLVVGGVIANDVPSVRVDNMPYGGVKESGFGREGVKYAIQDMTEIKLLVLDDVK